MFEFLFGLASIIIIDLVVSGDNAMVIALASRKLPQHQRKKAILWGTLGAVFIRILLTVVAVYLLKVPFLQAAGGLFLVYVAVKLLADENGDDPNVKQSTSLRQAVWTIIFADLVLSIDNIFAVAAAGKGHLILVLIGLAISIPIIVWGSGVILRLMNRFPALIYIGAGVLGWTAGAMLTEDKMVQKYVDTSSLDWVLPLLTTLVVLGLGRWLQTRHKHVHPLENEVNA